MRDRVARLLGTLGQVVTARDGLAALELMRSRHVDLVVTDVMMPRLDGLGLLKSIRQDPNLGRTPVVLLSARAGPEAAADAIEAGADDYVVKPYTPGELLARCRTSLELAEYRAKSAASLVRSTLLAGVSHDMQTPLAVITTSLGLLGGPGMDDEERAHIAERARIRAAQLTRLVTQFLDWSRLSMNQPLGAHRAAGPASGCCDTSSAEHERVRRAPGPAQLGALPATPNAPSRSCTTSWRTLSGCARSSIEIQHSWRRGRRHGARSSTTGPGSAPRCSPTLFDGVRPFHRDQGQRPGPARLTRGRPGPGWRAW